MDVACVVVPDFLVALARRDNPALRGRAVVIGGSPEEHAQVTACSVEASAVGVAAGTTLRKALTLCPNAVFLPLQEVTIAAEAERLLQLLRGYSPFVEAIDPGHAHIEIRGLARLTGLSEEQWLSDLQESASAATGGLPLRIGAAETVFAAHADALSTQYSALSTIRRGEARQFLAPFPIEILPVSPLMKQRLRLFGLERLGQLAELPFTAIQAQFGREGAHAWELAHGKDHSRIVPGREALRVTEEMDLPAPTALAEPLVVGTRGLLTRALARKEVVGQSVRRLDWRLGLESGEQLLRRFVFREPTNDVARMLFVTKQKIERLELPAAATSIGVTLSGLCSEYGHQSNLWPIGPRRWRELTESIEQLNARVGEPQVFRIVEVQPWSRIPERQLGLVAF